MRPPLARHPRLAPRPPAPRQPPPSRAAGGGGGEGLGEDVLARLKAAEAEAAKLREQLAAVQQGVDESSAAPPPAARRIDGPGLRRESPLGAGGDGDASWLSESQVDFFTGGGSGESSVPSPDDPAAAATVRRRLIIGGLATAATAAFALVPTDALRVSRPPAPLFIYLTPLVAALPLLAAAADAASNARWTELADLHARLEAPPLDVPGNLRAVAAHADTAPVRAAVAALARDGVEYVAQIDFNDYYEARGEFRGGAREAQFAEFSATAAREAVKTIEKLLALAPADAVEAARARAAAGAV